MIDSGGQFHVVEVGWKVFSNAIRSIFLFGYFQSTRIYSKTTPYNILWTNKNIFGFRGEPKVNKCTCKPIFSG